MKVIRYILVITVMIIIFMFSNQPADDSTRVSDSFILGISNLFSINIPLNDNVITVVRKSAHFTIYFILGLAVINLIITYNKTKVKTILISIIICLLYSISDEIHQLFVIGRSGEITDVFIDTVGATLGILIYTCFKNKNWRY